MHTRYVTMTGADQIDDGVSFLREKVAPALSEQKGYRGLLAAADWSAGVVGILSFWETAADRDASESTAGKLRAEALHIFGGELQVERFDQVVFNVSESPATGLPMVFTRISMDPSRIDANFADFTSEVLPAIRARRGFCALCRMIDRVTGEGLVGTVWTDEEAMEAWAAEGATRRQAARARGVSLGPMTFREIIYTDLA